MVHRFQCRCGTLQGEVHEPRRGVRAVCYCRDCQAYAHLLGAPDEVLDPAGGTDIVATQARYVRFTAGQDRLACLSLSPRGLLRWYARCCSTPVANLPRDWRLPYVGLVHTVLERRQPMDSSFGARRMHVNTTGARRPVTSGHRMRGWARFGALVARLSMARLTGGYRATPFFDASGRPSARIEVASRPDVERARAAVDASRA